MKRKILILILAVISCLACAFGFAACGDNDQKPDGNNTQQGGNTGNNEQKPDDGDKPEVGFESFEYTCKDGIYEITGVKDSHITEAVIPDKVTSIGRDAFRGCMELKTLVIPDGVTHIGYGAFEGCDSIENLTCSQSTLSSLSQYLGYLKNLKITSGTTDDKRYSLSAYNLTLTLGNEVTSIKVQLAMPVIQGTHIDEIAKLALTEIRYEGDIASWCKIEGLGNLMRYNADNTKFYIDNKVVTGELVIPDGVTSIGNYAFSGCSSLTSITIPESVTSIGDSAFSGCSSLTSITIPESVTSIGDSAFSGCSSLTSITIPGGVTSIGYGAFSSCSSLTSITIPDGVTSIGNYAFSGCSSLTSITIPERVTSIGDSAFSGCSSLTSITIPDRVTSIGYGAFGGCPIETATIPALAASYVKNKKLKTVIITSGDSIGDSAFSGCSSLTSITIPDSVTYISGSAFKGCGSLQYNEYDNGLYLGNYNNKYVVLVKAKNEDITSCTINANTKVIYCYVFKNCSKLTSIIIPAGVTSIGEEAFLGCRSLASITIPDGVTSIGNYAFDCCSSLTSIIIPDSVTYIGYGAFDACSSLTSIIIPDSVTYIGIFAFSGCNGLTSVTIPDSVTFISSRTFEYCRSLTSVTIPESVTSIGEKAFYNCSSLTKINYGGTKAQWNSITKYLYWNSDTGNYTVYCTDGEITK